MSISKCELIREYTKAIHGGFAAVFGGAGLSRTSGYVNWKELLKPLAKRINLDIEKEHDLLSVAQYYKNERGTRAGINQAIMEQFTKSVDINENVKILTRLPISTYWTTNYDSLIEDGIKEAKRNPDVKIESDQLSSIKPGRDAVVYKMHGDAEYPAHAVLTKYDYEMYEHNRPLFRTALKVDLISKSFLFIGFSFEDPNLDYILSQIHNLLGENVNDHYCFFKCVQKNDYTSLEDYSYAKAKQELREQDLKKYGIQTCFVNSYDEITDILREIEAAIKMKNIFISGSACEYKDPWSTQKAEDFAQKLSAKLIKKEYKIISGFGLGIGSSIINGALDEIYSTKYRHIDKYLSLYPFPQNISDTDKKEEKYSQYRKDMISETGISIFIFGNKMIMDSKNHKKIINSDGCKKEFEIAVKMKKIVIPVGSTGYMAKELLDEVKSNIDNFKYLEKYINRLECETDTDKLIDLIIEIIDSKQVN